jgi:hypothetical protein
VEWAAANAQDFRDELVGEWSGIYRQGAKDHGLNVTFGPPADMPVKMRDAINASHCEWLEFKLPVSIALQRRGAPVRTGSATLHTGFGGTNSDEAYLQVSDLAPDATTGLFAGSANYDRGANYLDFSANVDGVEGTWRLSPCGGEELASVSWLEADQSLSDTGARPATVERDALVGRRLSSSKDWSSDRGLPVYIDIGPAPSALTRVRYANRSRRPECRDTFRFVLPVKIDFNTNYSDGPIVFYVTVEQRPVEDEWTVFGLITLDDHSGNGERTAGLDIVDPDASDCWLNLEFHWQDDTTTVKSIGRPSCSVGSKE